MNGAQLKRMAQLEADLAVALIALMRIRDGLAGHVGLATDAIETIQGAALPGDWEKTFSLEGLA